MSTWQNLKNHSDLRRSYLIREQVTDTVRSFFKSQSFNEVQTPILVRYPSCEPNLEVFSTTLRTASGQSSPAYLILSPEYSLKKLLAAGFERIFEITHCFRNEEEVSPQHNPEFTMLEWYRTHADYTQIMTDFENLFTQIIKEVSLQTSLSSWKYQGETYDLSLPWPRISVSQAFQDFAGINTETLLSFPKLSQAAISKGYQVGEQTTWEQLFYQIFFNEIEPRLKSSHRPAFIYDYPLSQAALARVKTSDPRFAERFEVYLAGLELGNCFSELTDPVEQQSRLKADLKLRSQHHKTPFDLDPQFMAALKSGLPESAGIAVGVDRLVMLAADVPSIADTLLFPAADVFGLQSQNLVK